MNIKLTDKEISFLKKISKGEWLLKKDKEIVPSILTLIMRGYCMIYKQRIGPLGIYSGETAIKLTEAGETILENIK